MTLPIAAPPLRGIRHVALYAHNLEASEAFWIDVMGYRVEWRPDGDNVYLTSGSDNLALHRVAAVIVPGGVLDHLGLAVPLPGDVDAWAQRLATAGAPIEKAPKTHRDGSRSMYFRDPGGVLVQIIHHRPISL